VPSAPDVELSFDCDRAALPAALAERFVQLELDAAAEAFLARYGDTPHGALATAAYGVLRGFFSDYDAYGLLGMYPMHLVSRAQLDRLLGPGPRDALLDVGAGDGGVTAHAAPLFARTFVTEASSVLRRKLRARGFAVLEHDFATAPWTNAQRFDAALCLNVLDRTSHPRSLLEHLRAALAPAARLILSVPLPLRPHVHVGRHTVDPEERLPRGVERWEAGAADVARVLGDGGYVVRSLSRVPYLCRGDTAVRLHVLDAAIFACEVRAT
jgi:SAM-dependent methyltransferase